VDYFHRDEKPSQPTQIPPHASIALARPSQLEGVMKRIHKAMNLWTAALVVLIAAIAVYFSASTIVNTKSLAISLLAALAIGVTIFLALWALFGSLRGNRGKDEFNQMNLRLKEMAGGKEVPESAKSRRSRRG
jgi:cation transport ATPase